MKTDVLIVGGGPAGAASALFLKRQGIDSLIVEAEDFPRYHIGESMTGAAGQLLRDLGLEGEMTRLRFPVKCGVKVFGKSSAGNWFVPVRGRGADGNMFDAETWQVRRSEFDKMLLDKALDGGATLIHGKATRPVIRDGVVKGAHVSMRGGGQLTIESEMLLDCSGQSTWLANLGGVTGPKYVGAYDKQIAVFSHVRGAIRDSGTARDERKDNTLIFYKEKYHWAWFIPIDDETVSVGVVAPSSLLPKGESLHSYLTRELPELHPELKRRLPVLDLVEEVRAIPNYSYQVRDFCGKGFICIGDAHRFVDPIFSFGLSAALREAEFAASVVRDWLGGKNRDEANPFAAYQLFCEKGTDVLEDLLDTFWEHPFAFSVCVHNKYRDLLTDTFAGRVYEHEHQPNVAIRDFRRLLGREEERELSYLNGSAYSIPIGSRYHPERAPLWEATPGESQAA